MDIIERLLRKLEDKGAISRIPINAYSPPAFDAFGRMIGLCNVCTQETTSTCRHCKFFLCRNHTRSCEVCAGH